LPTADRDTGRQEHGGQVTRPAEGGTARKMNLTHFPLAGGMDGQDARIAQTDAKVPISNPSGSAISRSRSGVASTGAGLKTVWRTAVSVPSACWAWAGASAAIPTASMEARSTPDRS